MKKKKSNQKPTRLGSIDRLPARFHNAQEAVMTEDSSAEFMDVMDGNFPLLQPPANGVSSLNLQEEASNLWAKLAPKANYVGAKLHFTPPAKHEGKMDFELAQEEYNKAHLALQHDPHSLILQMELNQAREKKQKCSNLYGSLLKQKSKVDWIKFGDENSAYFHACIKNRRDTNRIASFVNEQGQVVEDYSKVVHHFLSHFKSFVGS
ncbi:hypothetical protein CsatA_006541 [Cannabis sativa]